MARPRKVVTPAPVEAVEAPVVAPVPAPARTVARPAASKPRPSLKVVAVQTGFYPKDFRRRKGSVFTLTDAAHFSDSTVEIVRRGKRTGHFGWMAWAEPGTPEHAVTAAELNDAAMGAKVAASNQDVI